MRRAIITSAATVSGLVILLSLKPHAETTAASTAPISSGTAPTGGTASGGTASGGTSSGTSTSGSSGSSKTGSSKTGSSTSGGSGSSSTTARTVTGSAVQTRYGPVQVQITVRSGKITNVSVLQYPTGDPHDQQINSYALPILNQEAISAQSAHIDAVSGATFTSGGYTSSLQSAIDKAGL